MEITQIDNSVVAALVLLTIIVFVWLLPIFIIGSSRKTSGSEKLAWILAVLFISWFAWIFYLLLAPLKKR
jgi:Mn2+/Fe2+ NRAMP family transporter